MTTPSYKLKVNHGFTLVEIMVAVSLFAVVAVITTGALVTASNVNRKAQAIKVAIDNLNFAIDSMVLNLQQGRSYHCSSNVPDIIVWSLYQSTEQCPGEDRRGNAIAFRFGKCSLVSDVCKKIIYRHYIDPSNNNGSIQIWRDSGNFVDITAPEINIKTFAVESETAIEGRVLLMIDGEVTGSTNTKFNFETTVYGQL
ncbi:MAG: type II secretion system protein [Patescibacteria group bacterium]